jgi:hypothetical protein
MFNHPLSLLQDILNQPGFKMNATFFQYARPGDGKHDDFRVIRGVDLLPAVHDLVKGLKPGHELGVSSEVHVTCDCGTCTGESPDIAHIPMIDFASSASLFDASDVCTALEKELAQTFPALKLHLYATGRSYHAYGTGLLLRERGLDLWYSKLLLVDPAGATLAIDHRWVGFSIGRGSMSLRLTNNTQASGEIKLVERTPSPWGNGYNKPDPDSYKLGTVVVEAEFDPITAPDAEPRTVEPLADPPKGESKPKITFTY